MSFPIPKLNIYLTELHDLHELVQNMLLLMGLCKDKVDNDNLDMFVLSIHQIISRYLNSFQRLSIYFGLLFFYTWILSIERYILLFFLFFFKELFVVWCTWDLTYLCHYNLCNIFVIWS